MDIKGAPMTIELCHWTDAKSADAIRTNGFNTPLVYLTNDPEAAKHYGGTDAEAIWVVVPIEALKFDFDDIVMGLDSANNYTDREWSLEEWVENHHSFAVPMAVANKGV
jgi:hypothetical protein